MICLKCKSNINDDANFCPICGTTIQHEQEPAPVTAEIEPAAVEAEPAEAPQAEMQQPEIPHQEEIRAEQNAQSSEEQGTPAPQPEPMAARRPQGRTFAPPQRQGMNAMPRSQAPSQRRRPLSEAEYLAVKKSLSTKTLIAFILSIFGICSITFDLPCAIIGFVFSMIVRNEYRNRGLQPDTDLKLANVAFICSIVGLVIGVIMLFVIFAFGVTVASLIAALSSMVSSAGSLYGGF